MTVEGEEVASAGSHEARVFNQVPADGIPQVKTIDFTKQPIYYLNNRLHTQIADFFLKAAEFIPK